MTAQILQLPPRYRIAYSFEGLDGYVSTEGGREFSTRVRKEAEWRLQQLRNKFGGRIIFWMVEN